MVGACICALFLILAATRLGKKAPPLDRGELLRLRRLSDRMRRDSNLPYE